MAYTAQLAAALSGATMRQLRHWRLTGVLEAELRTVTRVYYSYRDLVALRTWVFLRQDASLQSVRTAIGTLREMGQLEHLSAYTLASAGGTIVLIRDDETSVDLVKRPGHELVAHMAEVFRPFETSSGRRVLDFERPFPHVAIDPGMRGGHPVIRHTRIAFEAVAGLVADGIHPQDIRAFFPTVTAEAARDAYEFSAYVDGASQPSVA